MPKMVAESGAASTVSAAATSAVIFERRFGRRIAISISNVGANIAYLNCSDQQPSATSYGIALQPGTTWYDASGDSYRCTQSAISCISAAGTTLACFERCLE